ncbi:MAG: hypothetical protein NT024_01515 [Proteobacteria bacterium]|nr:hypothetical protein [Pseudomonadota bacterium]
MAKKKKSLEKVRVAMIGAPNTFHARAAVAELGKVFGLPAHELHRVTKLLPRVTAWNLPEAIAQSPEARELFPVPATGGLIRAAPVRKRLSDSGAEPLPYGRGSDQQRSYDHVRRDSNHATRGSDRAGHVNLDEPYATILKLAVALDGLPRHWAMHPCGLVVSPELLTDLVPVQRSPKGPLVAQYDMDAIEDLGFVKIDLLGQAGLSVLRDAVAEINRGAREGARSENVECRIENVELRMETGALPIQGRASASRESPEESGLPAAGDDGGATNLPRSAFLHSQFSILVPVLEKTYGLMVFEEHILQVATEFAGMNLGRADVLRRALNKRNLAMIAELKAEFHACARAKGRRGGEIDAVWSQVEGFAGFMFNKAHSAEYAVEAFQSAWLKRRWPAHLR